MDSTLQKECKNFFLSLKHLSIEELIRQYQNIVYRTTSTDIGEKASVIVPERPVLHGYNGKFSGVSD